MVLHHFFIALLITYQFSFLKMLHNNNNELVEQRMLLFNKYLDYSGMSHKDYQYEGVRWCLSNELSLNKDLSGSESGICIGIDVKGGFIADEMGLGKTILMIGTFYANFLPKTLVVVPLVLLQQWYNQILKTTGHRAIVYHGQKRFDINLNSISCCIVLTTYDMIKRFNKNTKNKIIRENIHNPLHSISWDRIVFDEGHHLRNNNTQVYLGALALKAQIRWIVSGTPIQNKKNDFYNLCAIIGIPASFYTNNNNLCMFVRYYILKRTKKQVGIDIEPVSLNCDHVSWNNKKEFELSKLIHSHLSFSNISSQSNWSGENIDLSSHLLVLLKARQSCILPKLLFKNRNELDESFLVGSSKINSVVQKILERKDNGNGKLVFCHFREEIDEVVRCLVLGGMYNVQTFDGRVKINKRKEILHGTCGGGSSNVLILQIQTGCEGLNLQDNYSEIYFVSPSWNPAVEDQAVARCHRIGQKKQVEVFRFKMDSFLDEELESETELETNSTLSLDSYVSYIQEDKRSIAMDILG